MMAFAANDSMVGYVFVPEDEYKDQTPKNGSLDPFRTKDGYVTIAPYTDDQWSRLLTAIGHPEWWEIPDRRERLRTCLKGIAALFPEQDSAHWLKKLEEADCPGGPVHTYDTLFSDPEIIANENFTLYEHPQAGTVRATNPGMRFSETPARMWRIPPALGEQTEEILRETGLSRERIAELRQAKVIN
jgi:crotonobetainyl-CoA:carnitine CoA-transferase CaiB-like acyl-CoA transferase